LTDIRLPAPSSAEGRVVARPASAAISSPRRRWLRLVAYGLLAGGVLACGLGRTVPGPYIPEVVGVVTATELVEGNLTRFSLENGQSFTVDQLDGNALTTVYGAGGGVDDLLLGGTDSGKPWLALVRRGALTRSDLPDGCYALEDWGTDDGVWIQADSGLRLRKAPDFDPGLLPETPGMPAPTSWSGMRYEGTQQTFCLDRDGQVTRVDHGQGPG